MLSLGACVVGRRDESFYAELKPLNTNAVPDALKVTSFDLAELVRTGERPEDAMGNLRTWVVSVSAGTSPVFVGFDAGFDWPFVNWYFHRFVGENPFGFAPLDIKSYYMGLTGCSWAETKSSRIRTEYQPTKPGSHNALADARAQAEMFERMLASSKWIEPSAQGCASP
jgi:DNA polymerase III epsilon subunit-like protein